MGHRALIVFVKEPRPGEVKTRLGQAIGMERAAEIYRACAEEVLDVARELARRDVHVTVSYAPGSDPERIRRWVNDPLFHLAVQEGASLGDRMRTALARAMEHGAAKVLLVGSDVPELDEPLFDQAWDQLERNDLVLGPSPDGGYYLSGMRPPLKDLFAGILWSSAGVYEATRAAAAVQGLSVGVLPVRADIDWEEDFRAYQQRLRERGRSARRHHH
jgi:rSAM/selenodomain-associated transferase 1